MTPEEAMEPVLAAAKRLHESGVMGATIRSQEDHAAVRDAIVALIVRELETCDSGENGLRTYVRVGLRLAEWRAARSG